jgi:acetyl esterase/lipase
MRPTLLCLLLSLTSVPTLAVGGAKVRKDIAYSDAGGNRTSLDVYAPGEGEDHPVVIWVHGGAWQIGDKRLVQAKPTAFNEQGYVLVSVNYRLHPAVTYKEQAGDIAQAIRWAKDHSGEHGGDPGRIFLMGHSAGAHLAALVGTDGRYLKEAGLKLSDLSGVILLDGAGYDIPRQIRQAMLPRLRAMYTNVFTEDEATQRDASPVTHVARGKGIPPFLILHVASRRDSKAQSEGLAARLREAGVEAKVVPAEGKTHATINRELGEPDDAPTGVVFEFLRGRCAETGTR